MNGPVILGISLPERHIPMLNLASDLLRAEYPGMSDADILERIVCIGLISTIDALGPRLKHGKPAEKDGV